ncbi:MAG: hypothetical protein ISS88_02590 [Candidatus Portnoybacteria bacterium]|nr:hypothetical protein [Candidatus Portnoybacteria bacterium]
MYKIPIIITNGKKDQILKELKASDFDLDKIDISEQKKKSLTKAKIGFFWFRIKSRCQISYQDFKEWVKYRRLEPKFGGGGLDIDLFYGLAFYTLTAIVLNGLAYDTVKFIVKKSYKFLKSKKVDYLLIISETRQPFDCIVKILIPNNLEEEELDQALDQGKEIFINLDNIRNYFGKRQIIVKYIRDYQWKIKFK